MRKISCVRANLSGALSSLFFFFQFHLHCHQAQIKLGYKPVVFLVASVPPCPEAALENLPSGAAKAALSLALSRHPMAAASSSLSAVLGKCLFIHLHPGQGGDLQAQQRLGAAPFFYQLCFAAFLIL